MRWPSREQRRHWRLLLISVACAAAVAWWWQLRQPPGESPALTSPDAADQLLPISVAPLPSTHTLTVKVQRNETLEQIFRRLALSVTELARMRENAEVRHQLDRLTAGETLQITYLGELPERIARELSLTERQVIARSNAGYTLTIEPKPVQLVERLARGTISSSLFAAGDAAGISDTVILRLAYIFGWDVDFALDIRAGDEFTVSYQRLYQYGRFIQDGEILAARFVNQGREFRAVRYQAPDGKVRYYTPDGHSMERAFLRAPLEFRRVSSRFSRGRYHPILNRLRAHQGVDYAASTGTRVYAAGAGRIRKRGLGGGYGNVIEIDHGAGIATVYGHLSRFAAGQSAGSRVAQGEVIGYVGSSGLATGPHLHYEYRINGRAVDPQRVKLPDASPLDPALQSDFYQQTTPLLAAFNPNVGPPTAELPSRR